jgi:hypothetical protein
MDDLGVRRFRNGQVIEEITWDDLTEVTVVTTSDGPAVDDVFFLLLSANGSGVAVPSERLPVGFIARLQTLPGFDNAMLIEAMGSHAEAQFPLWPPVPQSEPRDVGPGVMGVSPAGTTDEAPLPRQQRYEERYEFQRPRPHVVVISVLFVLAALVVPMDLGLRVADLAFFGGGLVLMFAIGRYRRVALRADETGLLLGGAPLRYDSTTINMEWRDIAAVILWRHPTFLTQAYVGVSRQPSPDRGDRHDAVSGFDGAATDAVTGLARDLTAPSRRLRRSRRPIHGWSLDLDQFAAVLREHAPDVPLIDLR